MGTEQIAGNRLNNRGPLARYRGGSHTGQHIPQARLGHHRRGEREDDAHVHPSGVELVLGSIRDGGRVSLSKESGEAGVPAHGWCERTDHRAISAVPSCLPQTISPWRRSIHAPRHDWRANNLDPPQRRPLAPNACKSGTFRRSTTELIWCCAGICHHRRRRISTALRKSTCMQAM
jgi:hypothetical protein